MAANSLYYYLLLSLLRLCGLLEVAGFDWTSDPKTHRPKNDRTSPSDAPKQHRSFHC